jgi:predicted nuclease of restriction endonuclease-like (RecB) superfamily
LLIEAQGGEDKAKYGNALIKEYSEKLTNEIGRGYTFSALSRMRQFYLLSEKIATLSQQLTWSHYCELLVFDNVDEINYYIKQTEIYNLSVRELREKIKSKEYQRLDDNTKLKLINKEETVVSDFIKNPIVIRNKYNIDKKSVTEKILQRLILEDIPSFLKELGDGFTFVENEYKIKIGNTFNYIDLLLYNIKFNCYVVIELKVTELKKEHIGQIQIYMNYVDKNIKTINQDKTIGVIICKKDNGYYIEYSSDNRIFSKNYILS